MKIFVYDIQRVYIDMDQSKQESAWQLYLLKRGPVTRLANPYLSSEDINRKLLLKWQNMPINIKNLWLNKVL